MNTKLFHRQRKDYLSAKAWLKLVTATGPSPTAHQLMAEEDKNQCAANEMLWQNMKRAVHKEIPTILNEPEKHRKDEWDKIHPQQFEKLIIQKRIS